MLMAEILHSCADEGIAEAAVASIGGAFASEMRAEAARSGLSVGALTGDLISGFAIDATERDWRQLAAGMEGADHPVLRGVQSMAEAMLRRRHRPSPSSRRPPRETPPAPHPAATPGAASSCTL